MKYPVIIMIAFAFFTLFGCSGGALKNNTYYQLILTIERSIGQEEWEDAQKQVESLKIYYNQNYMILKRLGENEEYIQINKEIESLQKAVKERDKEAALVQTADIKEVLEIVFDDESLEK